MSDDNELETTSIERKRERALVDELLILGGAFDEVAEDLAFQQLPAANDRTAPPLVDVVAYARTLGGSEPEVQQRIARLDEFRNKGTLNRQEYRFNVARVIAAFEIDRLKSTSVSGQIAKAIGAYSNANRLGTSAIDVLASAILLPKNPFDSWCRSLRHDIVYLAALFDLPKGAIALRQQMLHPPTSEGGDDDERGTLEGASRKAAA